MSKCIGCGEVLSTKKEDVGYTSNINNKLCERCFKIRNYNEYKTVVKDNNEYYKIIDSIGDDLTVLVIDLFDIPSDLDQLVSHLNKNVILVLTKFDLIPSIYEDKFITYFKNNYHFNILDYIVISSNKNYNIDLLYHMIKKYMVSDKVYFVGYTNAGKSSLINKLIYNYSDIDTKLTVSNLPSTTLNKIEINLDDIILIDTPGIVNNRSLINYLDSNNIKKVIPSKKIKPITYQIKTKQIIEVDNLFRIDCYNNNSLTLYLSNKLNINRYYNMNKQTNLEKKHIIVSNDSDIVIQGLGFIHVIKRDEFDIYIDNNINVYIRKSIM